MKKLFISIPLKDRSKDDVEASVDKIKDAVEGLLDEKVEVLHQDYKDLPNFDSADFEDNLSFLAKDIELMADADYFATIDCNYDYRHCALEEDIFCRYQKGNWEERRQNIFKFSVNVVAPDIVKKERELAKKFWGERALKEEEVRVDEEVIEEKENRD